LALCEPLPTDFRQQLGSVGLVEHDRTARPAVAKGEPVEFVLSSYRGDRYKFRFTLQAGR
ncbi:MAG: hypothetical protein ACK47M_10695, partial [Caldilinea sp.]